MPKYTQYTSEFKREAVKLAQSSDQPTSTVAKEMGIKPNTLYNWIYTAMKQQVPTSKSISTTKHRYQDLEKENRDLKKNLKRAKMERDILKKAIAYFTSLEE